MQYGDNDKIISINFENTEDLFQVIIFLLENGKMPDYDDKTKTLHLNQIINLLLEKLDKKEFDLNNEYFDKFKSKNELGKKLLKSAKELRLCLKQI